MLFCGDAAEPLLVQRIGKARDAAAAEGPASGESGAKAVPSLGYVRRHSGQEVDRLLVEAAERAVAEHWARGKTVALPLPPPGLQWALDAAPGQEEAAERAVKLTATLGAGGGWSFSIAGREVEAFDARAVIAPCSLDLKNHKPLELDPGSERASLLRVALYVVPDEARPLWFAPQPRSRTGDPSRLTLADQPTPSSASPLAAAVLPCPLSCLRALASRTGGHFALGRGGAPRYASAPRVRRRGPAAWGAGGARVRLAAASRERWHRHADVVRRRTPTLRLVATTVRVPPPLSRSSSNLAGLIHSLIRRSPSP